MKQTSAFFLLLAAMTSVSATEVRWMDGTINASVDSNHAWSISDYVNATYPAWFNNNFWGVDVPASGTTTSGGYTYVNLKAVAQKLGYMIENYSNGEVVAFPFDCNGNSVTLLNCGLQMLRAQGSPTFASSQTGGTIKNAKPVSTTSTWVVNSDFSLTGRCFKIADEIVANANAGGSGLGSADIDTNACKNALTGVTFNSGWNGGGVTSSLISSYKTAAGALSTSIKCKVVLDSYCTKGCR